MKKNGHTFLAIDLTSIISNYHFNLLQEGTVSLEIRLKNPHDKSITTIIYLEFDLITEQDTDRNFTLNKLSEIRKIFQFISTLNKTKIEADDLFYSTTE